MALNVHLKRLSGLSAGVIGNNRLFDYLTIALDIEQAVQ
jgi:hypothetical protein